MGRWLWAALGISGLAGACDKTEAPAGALDPASTAAASASGTSTEDAGDAGDDVGPLAAPLEGGAPSEPVDAGPSPFEAPLLHWMKGHAAVAMRQGDLTALALAFDQIATFSPKAAPSAYANWTSIAKDGAAAARAASVEGVRAACRGCHTQYRAAYKAEMRARALP